MTTIDDLVGDELWAVIEPLLPPEQLGIKPLKILKPAADLHQICLRWFRPEEYLLLSLSDEAARLRVVEHRVRSICKTSWSREHVEQLEFLAASYPARFLRSGGSKRIS